MSNPEGLMYVLTRANPEFFNGIMLAFGSPSKPRRWSDVDTDMYIGEWFSDYQNEFDGYVYFSETLDFHDEVLITSPEEKIIPTGVEYRSLDPKSDYIHEVYNGKLTGNVKIVDGISKKKYRGADYTPQYADKQDKFFF